MRIEEAEMQFGFKLPNTGAFAAPDVVVRIARKGEALGYDYLTVTDHVVLPDVAEPGYPYSEERRVYRATAPTATMLTLASIWRRSPRDCALRSRGRAASPGGACRQDARDDRCAVRRPLDRRYRCGWLKTEFDAVVTTPFAERGAVTDEYVAAFRALWTADKPKIDGRMLLR